MSNVYDKYVNSLAREKQRTFTYGLINKSNIMNIDRESNFVSFISSNEIGGP